MIKDHRKRSNCCDAPIHDDTDICSKCKEHCDTMPEEENMVTEETKENHEVLNIELSRMLEIIDKTLLKYRLTKSICNYETKKEKKAREFYKAIDDIVEEMYGNDNLEVNPFYNKLDNVLKKYKELGKEDA